MFKKAFKHYKKKTLVPDVQDVIDFDLFEENKSSYSWYNVTGLHPEHMWRCYKVLNHPGLLVIRNSFTSQGQRYWIARSLRDYPRAPSISNLDANNLEVPILSDWWGELQNCSDVNIAQRIKVAMRWTTLGYHHNWDTKVYSEAMHSAFPSDLSSLCQYFSLALGFNKFTSQAAIINYYPIGTTLSGHTDHSELNREAPLFSFSFGQSAIFLIGGVSLEEQPTAIYLCSGDVLIMSMEARLCYHAVPRVMKADEEPWNSLYNTYTENNKEAVNTDLLDLVLYEQVKDEMFWIPFNRYINDSRININVRQVLPAGLLQIPLKY
ncbi:nucleic acid dioxygenase ALKBH1 isoform X2 [Drosophila innubila]|uniref:nucleic acid dioxygenase ALKBH1 isoform X2 n=1 Tax=Drosophila innubila TaxID=198719 RepID=UPI00148E1905|nr:nucleic acid dioxygenase ALKBH1 isoform X2 [Drosophila innubila]